MKRAFRIIVLIVATGAIIGLLAWFFRGEDPRELAEAFRTARWRFLPIALVMGMLVFPVKALRWRLLLGSDNKIKILSLLSAIMIGFMANCIISRVGELVRAAVLGAKRETRTSIALASIALERIFDMCTVILFLVIALLWLRPAASGEGATHLAALRKWGAILAIILALGIVFLALLRTMPKRTTKLVLRCVDWLPRRLRERVRTFLESFLAGLNTIRSARQAALILLISIFHWLLQVLYFLFIGYCFPDLGLALPGAMLVFVATALGVAALPLPGYLGIFQGGVLAAAAIMGVLHAERTAWISYSWASWALSVLPVILVGFLFLWAEGLSLKELRGRVPREAGASGKR